MSNHLPVTHLPADAPGCGWYETLPPPAPPRVLEGDIQVDWVVLGAGVAGLAAARRLAMLRPDDSVALIDAQRIGHGASGRNSGFMIDLPHALDSDNYTGRESEDRRLITANRAAIAYMREIVQQHGIECDWSEQGKIHAAVEPQGVRALDGFRRSLERLGEPCTPLNAAELRETLGTGFYRAGLHTPGTVLLQPAALMRGLGQTMPENVIVYEDSPVTGYRFTSSSVLLDTAAGSIQAGNLLLANNGFAAALGMYRNRLIPVCTYASMTRPLGPEEREALGGAGSWGLIPADRMGTTVRRLPDHRILIRNTFTYNPRLTHPSRVRERVRRRHARSFRNRFPMLADVDFEYTWGGVLCLSRNASPGFGQVAPRVFAAVCQNGVGLARGTIAGKLIAELAHGEDSDLLRDVLALPAPSRNPPAPLLRVGVSGSIAWRQWRAGREM